MINKSSLFVIATLAHLTCVLVYFYIGDRFNDSWSTFYYVAQILGPVAGIAILRTFTTDPIIRAFSLMVILSGIFISIVLVSDSLQLNIWPFVRLEVVRSVLLIIAGVWSKLIIDKYF